MHFLNANVEDSDDKKDRISCTILYELFKQWFNANYQHVKIPYYKEFIYGVKKYKDITKPKINGISQAGN